MFASVGEDQGWLCGMGTRYSTR